MSQLNHAINNKKIYLFVILTFFFRVKFYQEIWRVYFFPIRVNKNVQNQAIETHIYMYGFHQTVILTP